MRAKEGVGSLEVEVHVPYIDQGREIRCQSWVLCYQGCTTKYTIIEEPGITQSRDEVSTGS